MIELPDDILSDLRETAAANKKTVLLMLENEKRRGELDQAYYAEAVKKRGEHVDYLRSREFWFRTFCGHMLAQGSNTNKAYDMADDMCDLIFGEEETK